MLDLKIVSSLEKVMPKLELEAEEITALNGLFGETVSFQIAYADKELKKYNFEIKGAKYQAFFVENVPVEMASLPNAAEDKNYISHDAGLYPDRLVPVDRDFIQAYKIYHSIWVSCKLPRGNHSITVRFFTESGETVAEKSIEITVLNNTLPKQKLIYTDWFYNDCIAVHYGYEMFSDEHFVMIEKFMKMAKDFGMNMILTPVFTPPLDTDIGKKRPLTQLVKIEKSGKKYTFGFENLVRYIRLCKKVGFKYFEMPHLFTQWGAKCTPRISATVNGKQTDIFGWDVPATSAKYKNFLSQFLPALITVLKAEKIDKNTYFHISDEPQRWDIENYKNASEMAKKYLKGFKIIDALSNIEFYKDGIIKIPVPATDHISPFLEEKPKERWCYYCCMQGKDVSNRFLAMPSARNRSIGLQLFKFRMDGFLHWGYNYYYSSRSRFKLNVYACTDAYGAFPSGDSFVVYPGENGPLPTISFMVFREALNDLRALKLLEKQIGYNETVKFIENVLGKEITFDTCFTADKILDMRKAVNEKVSLNK